MRIRHVLPQPAMGTLPPDPPNSAMTGLVGAAWYLAAQQAAAGHQVEVIAPARGASGSRIIAGVKVHWLPRPRGLQTARYDFSSLVPLMLFMFKSRSADVVHVHGNPYFMIGSRAKARILHLQDSSIQGTPRYGQAVARADQVICCSHFIRRQFLAATNYPPSRVNVVPNGVDWKLFVQADRGRSRAKYGIADNQQVLLYVGRIVPDKGLIVLIEALDKMIVRGVGAPLLLVAGSGRLGYEADLAVSQKVVPYEQYVRQRTGNLPVRFLGDVPRPALPELYRAADLFVCPSIYQEPFGMVNVEAAAAGLPVIASAVGGIPDAVFDGQNGLLVPPGDAQALADALLRLTTSDARRTQMGYAAQALATQFDWGVIEQRVAAIYSQALNRKSVGHRS